MVWVSVAVYIELVLIGSKMGINPEDLNNNSISKFPSTEL
jgi:hypothetical protein